MEVAAWLRNLGLERYEPAFRANEITVNVLPELTDADLRELGLPLGPRKLILQSIASLQASAQTAAEPRAERRQLSVMFCDLVGSTALSARLDPEDLHGVIGAYHDCVAEIVSHHGGFVAQYLGDGALVYFGYPQAHEHDAEQAIRSGLALVEAVGRLGTAAGQLQIRIGIATGLVVAGDLFGPGEGQERGAVGQTPNLAARLQAFAEPDAVVIDKTTRRLGGGLFTYTELGVVSAKGLGEPVHAWRVLRESAIASRFEALRARQTPLVGREEELGLLLRGWEQVKRGEGRVLLLSGEPGIGKSRLVAALEDSLKAEPHVKLRYFCSPYHANSALFPFMSELERAAAFAHNDSPEAKLGKLERVLGPPPPSTEDVALLAELLSLPVGGYGPPVDLTPQRRKEKNLEALLRRQERLSKHTPLFVLFEDVHWIDPTSRELLDLMIEQAARLPVLLLITQRPEVEPSLVGQPHVTWVAMDRLPRPDAAALVEEVAGPHVLTDDVLAEILDRTDGVPLFIEELTRAVLEAGAGEDAARNILSGASAKTAGVPVTLQASLTARLDRLPPETRALAQIGATLGREFSHALLAATAGIEPEALETGLAQLNGAALVFRRGTPPDAVYSFKHALVQDVAYGTLLRGPRQALHARIARAVRERLPETAETQPELLARHFTEAGLQREAIYYWRRAGVSALARFATAEAAVRFRAALRLVNEIPDSPERQAEKAELHLRLGEALRAASGIQSDETNEAFRIAYELSSTERDVERLPKALYGLLLSHLNRADLRIADSLAIELQTLGRDTEDRAVLVQGLETRGMVLFALGEFTKARRELEQAVAATHARSGESTASNKPAFHLDPNALVYLALTLFALGFPVQARERLEQGFAAAAAAPPLVAVFTMNNACYFHQIEGDWRAAQKLVKAMIAAAIEKGMPHLLPFGKLFLDWSLAEAGLPAEGIAQSEDFRAAIQAGSYRLEVPYLLAVLAQTQFSAGRQAYALEIVEEALTIMKLTDERWFEPELHRLQGKCALHVDTIHRAEECFQRALEVARKQAALMWELRAAVSLGRLWRSQGRHAEARKLLVPICNRFGEGFETPEFRAAKVLAEPPV